VRRRYRVPRAWNQGDLDFTCGLVSSINAIRLCIGGAIIDRGASVDLFSAGARYLLRRRFLDTVLADGMSGYVHVQLLRFLCRDVAKRHGVRLVFERPYVGRGKPMTMAILAQNLAHFLAVPGRAVIISFASRDLIHFTVVWRVTRSRLLLNDGVHRELPLRECSTARSALNRGHRFYVPASSVILLRTVPHE
jgi:hypothetical protein